MRRAFVNIVSILFAFAIEKSIFPMIPNLSSAPNLLLIFTFSIAFLYGEREGMLYGLLCGLLMDLFYSGSFGFYMLVFLVIGFLNGLFSRYYYEDFIVLPMILCAFNLLFYDFYIFFFRFYIYGSRDLVFFLRKIILPELIMTLIFALILYMPIFRVNRFLAKEDAKWRRNRRAE